MADRLDELLQNTLARQLQEQFPDQTLQLKLLDRDAFATIQQLIEAGVLNANQDTARTLYRAPATDRPKADGRSRRLTEARDRLAQGEHKRRMAKVRTEGGFSTEALVPMREAVETALQALTHWQGHNAEVQPNLLPNETVPLISLLRNEQSESDDAKVGKLLTQSDSFLLRASSVLESAQGV